MCTLWYFWFASSIAMPFFMGFSEATGTVAFADSYGFAALGMFIGLWLASYPAFQGIRAAVNRPAYRLLTPGLFITLTLWVFEIARFCLLENMILPTWILRANAALAPMERPAAFLNAMLCAICAPQPAQSQKLSLSRQGLAVALLGFVAGITRGWFWTLLLPSPTFPIPATSWNISIENRWSDGLPLPVGIVIAFLLVLSWCHLARKLQEQSGAHDFAHVIGAFCLGELAWRLASRVSPHILQISLSCAAAALLAQIACLAIAWMYVGHARRTTPQNCSAQNNVPAAAYPPLSPLLKELFDKHRLTVQESAVTAASFRGLSSAQVAMKLGISASTVRTYRARACDKLHVSSIDELIGNFEQPDDAPSVNVKAKSNPSQTMCMLSTMGAWALAFLIFIPPAETAACWEATWLIPFGGALGLILPVTWQTVRESHSRQRNMAIGKLFSLTVVLAVIIAAAALQYCYGILAQSNPYAPQPTLLRIGTMASVAACMVIAGERLFRSEDSERRPHNSSPLALLGAAALSTLGSFSRPCWHMSVTIAAILICLEAVSLQKDVHVNRASCALASPLTLLYVATLAFIWEEALRGMSYASLQSCGIIFLAASSCALILQMGKHLLHGVPTTIALVLCSIVLTYTKGLVFGLLVTATVLGLLHATSTTVPRAQFFSPWHASPIAAAFGLCAAVYTANFWGSSIANGDGNVAFTTTLSLLLSLLGAVALGKAARSSRQGRPHGDVTSTESMVSTLQSYKLTTLQLSVVLRVAQGRSIGQIAQELSYSRSRVHQVLKEIYAALNLRNHAQLKAFLAQANIDHRG